MALAAPPHERPHAPKHEPVREGVKDIRQSERAALVQLRHDIKATEARIEEGWAVDVAAMIGYHHGAHA